MKHFARDRRPDRLVLACALALPFLGCREDPDARRGRAEVQVLERQLKSLRELIAATREKRLVDPDWIATAVDEAAVESILDAGLPQEAVVGTRLRVQVESADVTFQGGTALVKLKAHVTDERSPDRRASVVLRGGLDDMTISPEGYLETRVLVDHVEVPEVAGAGMDVAPFLRTIVDELAGRNLQALQNLAPALSIPVKFEQSLAFAGRSEGPVQMDPGELPVAAKVARVLPVAGRLWVFLDVKVGPWRGRAAASGSTSSPARGRTP